MGSKCTGLRPLKGFSTLKCKRADCSNPGYIIEIVHLPIHHIVTIARPMSIPLVKKDRGRDPVQRVPVCVLVRGRLALLGFVQRKVTCFFPSRMKHIKL